MKYKQNEFYTITQVFKTGEKVGGYWSTRGRKPLGYYLYMSGVFKGFIDIKDIDVL